MTCEQCGQEPATTRVTEVARGRASEIRVCDKCAQELSLVDWKDAFRCEKCGTEIGNAECLEWVRAAKAKREKFDEQAWNELLDRAACPVCGAALKLPRIPWALVSDPSFAVPLLALFRRRPRSHPFST